MRTEAAGTEQHTQHQTALSATKAKYTVVPQLVTQKTNGWRETWHRSHALLHLSVVKQSRAGQRLGL